jgi:hypothetical protein
LLRARAHRSARSGRRGAESQRGLPFLHAMERGGCWELFGGCGRRPELPAAGVAAAEILRGTLVQVARTSRFGTSCRWEENVSVWDCPLRWHLHVISLRNRGIAMYRFGGAREAVKSWGSVASPNREGIVGNGCPRKRFKIEFFSALVYFHL